MNPVSTAEVSGKKILVRGDIDVAIQNGEVVEDYRLEAMLPTLNLLIEKGAQIWLVGHLGRPKGQVVPELSVRPVAEKLEVLLGRKIHVVTKWHSSPTKYLQENPTGITLLENIRFDPREESNDAAWGKQIATMFDLYVNECFSTSHRKHTSFVEIPKNMPSYAGIRLEEEVSVLQKVRTKPARPLVFIVGGGKVETKLHLVQEIATFADNILLGGVLGFAQELEGVKGVRFPVDARRVDDIGPQTAEVFNAFIKPAGTIIWVGPMGRYEEEDFIQGTQEVGKYVAESLARKIVGGGDTITALDKLDLLEKMDYVSVGGGAMLEFLARGTLPGLEALL